MIIVDGSHLLHRCRYSSPEIDWKEYCKTFCGLFLAILKTLNERRAIVCWNLRGSRKKRLAVDIEDGDARQEYLLARKWLHESLPKLGFCSLLAEGIETGETAYWLINRKLKTLDRGTNYLISADKNWLQLINEFWHVYNPLIGEAVAYIDFCRKYVSKPYYNVRRALLGTYATVKCYGMTEANVDHYVEKVINGEELIDASLESVHLSNFVADGQLTRNVELLDLGMPARGERGYLNVKYSESVSRVEHPSFWVWVELACQIDAPALVLYS